MTTREKAKTAAPWAVGSGGWLWLIFDKVWSHFFPTTVDTLQSTYAENLQVLGESLQSCLKVCQ
jgi:hypothetical protein